MSNANDFVRFLTDVEKDALKSQRQCPFCMGTDFRGHKEILCNNIECRAFFGIDPIANKVKLLASPISGSIHVLLDQVRSSTREIGRFYTELQELLTKQQ